MRMIDTQINGGLQRGAAFFASTSIIAIGLTDIVLQVFQDIPIKIKSWTVGIGTGADFHICKFGWSYRLYNYCGIHWSHSIRIFESHTDGSKEALAANMNIIAARHFSAGLRGIFFASGSWDGLLAQKCL